MGHRIKRPMDFQGITRKEARTTDPTQGNFTMEGNCLNSKWQHWNEMAEGYLAEKEGKISEEYYGKGKPIEYVKNTISAPQDKSDGSAVTTELRTQQRKLSRMKKFNILCRKGKERNEEGYRLKQLMGIVSIKDIDRQEEIVAKHRQEIKNEI
jgi:hypothetical protein